MMQKRPADEVMDEKLGGRECKGARSLHRERQGGGREGGREREHAETAEGMNVGIKVIKKRKFVPQK